MLISLEMLHENLLNAHSTTKSFSEILAFLFLNMKKVIAGNSVGISLNTLILV